jgi:hypothetical protein
LATAADDPQLESLLQVKSFIDKAGVLKSWSRQAGQNKGYCSFDWVGVWCSEQVVYEISLFSRDIVHGLQGQLPPASAFQGLPGLTKVEMRHQPALAGTLPPDWSRLQKLQHVWLEENSLTGSLPPSWGQLRQLKELVLFSNKLSGPLPDAYKSLTALTSLRLSNNSLTGSVPPSWASMTQLKDLGLSGNPKLSGCLPTSWMQQLTRFNVRGSDVYTTALKGFC